MSRILDQRVCRDLLTLILTLKCMIESGEYRYDEIPRTLCPSIFDGFDEVGES